MREISVFPQLSSRACISVDQLRFTFLCITALVANGINAAYMLTFVVSHNSDNVALLVAVCIQLFYGKTSKILIVKQFNGNQNTAALAPWCGVSTLSEIRNQTWMLHNNQSLMRILSPSLVPLDLFRFQASAEKGIMHPDLPVSGPKVQISAGIAAGSSNIIVGLLYNPSILSSNLKLFLLNSSNVSFLSVPLYAALLQLVASLPGEVIWVDFLGRFDLSRNWKTHITTELLVLPHMSSVHFSQGFEDLCLPSSIVWLPMLKANTGMNVTPEFDHRLSYSGNRMHLDIRPTNLNIHEQDVCLKYDLMYSLSICDKVLDSLESFFALPSKL